MTKYTAADFANAKFAEHKETSDYAARIDPLGPFPWESTSDTCDDEDMARTGWVPVPTKPTITESQYKLALDEERDPQYVYGFTAAMHLLGGEVIPDPEPTNKERLAQLIGGGHESNKHYADGLAEYLDDMGVTAPNVKGN